MATLAFKPYIYVPTPPRSKSAVTRHRPAPEQVSILNKLQQIRPSIVSLSTPRPAAPAAIAVADSDGAYMPGIRGTGTVYGGSDKENDDDNDDDGRDLPTIEKLLLAKLQEQGFAAEDRGHRERGDEEAAVYGRGGSTEYMGSALGDNSSGSPEDPIVLQGDGDSSASEAEVNAESAIVPGAGLFNSPETTVDSTTPAPPCSSDEWHDIDDSPETAPCLLLAVQGASTSNSIHPHTSSSRLSSESLPDSVTPKGSRSARSEATASSSSLPLRHCKASLETQLNREGRLHAGRGVTDEHKLVDSTLDTLLADKGARKQQEMEKGQENDEGNSEDEDEGPQQEMNTMASVVTAERAGGSPRPANRRQSLPDLDLSLEPSCNKARSRSGGDSDDELNSTDSAEDEEEKPCPSKRKKPSSAHDSPTRKKHRRRLQQSPSHQCRPLSEPHHQYPKSHFPLNQYSRGATSSSAKGRLPSPAPSIPQRINTKMPLDDSSPDRLSRATLPTLTEITFRPHSTHCCSFTAIIRAGYDGRGVSFGQLARLIASTGHVGKIDDFTIKPVEQHSYLLSGFSRRVSSPDSFGTMALSTTADAGRDYVNATRTLTQEGRAGRAGAFTTRGSERSSSDDDGRLTDSDPDLGSEDDGCSSEDELSRPSTRMNVSWEALDEQRLLAWKKEGKPWDWIFKKFPGRTEAAVRTRWTMVQRRLS